MTSRIDHSINSNKAKAFVGSNIMLQVHSTIPEETKCSGLFCNKQHLHEILSQGHGCGCYHMLGRRSNIAVDHLIQIKSIDMNIVMERFSSMTFSSYYLT
eukprot:4682863-Ditylum_brightwellii.AAC.1